MTGEALKDIADKALMGKLKEVDSDLEESKSVNSVSVKRQESGVQEIKSVKISESELDNVGKADYVEQVLDEESEKSEKALSEKVVSDSEDEGNFLDQYIPKSEKTKKLKEESVKTTFVEYDKRVCHRCSEVGHMAKQCQKVIEKPVVVKPVQKPIVQKPIVQKPSVQKQTVQKSTVQKSNVQKPRPKSPIDTKGKKPMVSPIRILKRGESLKSEDKPKSTFEVGESSKTRKTSKIYPKTKVFENQSWVAKSKPSVEVKKMENALKIDSNIFKDDVVEFENEIDKFLAEFPPITNKVKSSVKEEVSNVTFSFQKTDEKCDVVFGSVSEGLRKSILSKWIMDSGASRHMTRTLALLYDVKSIN
ncbi:serum response factor-binding protein 1-like [Helianthus annuus]|uniref:serum response factor-binding protein 1-like n=1 Tax=Helianthus annuus TaxID=4232 RepID=UPI000B9040B2|nr:serum response factor-binding protein 1-like [Helianthus annuus]